MATNYGTLTILDTIRAKNAATVLQFGEEELAGFLDQILAAYEGLVEDMVGDLVTFTTERETTYGTNAAGNDMVDLDEGGLADAQKLPFDMSSVGFPLRRTGYTIQWTRDYLATTSPLELANQVLAATEADTRRVYKALRTALFKATNNTSYRDMLVDRKNYTIRALVNADSQAMPPQPITGTAFTASSHTHYLGTGSFVAANLSALIETVREHFTGSDMRLIVYINSAQEATVRGFSGFYPYTDARLIYGTTADRAAQTVDLTQLEDRAIGIFGAAEVWVKPWMPASYVFAFNAAADEKVLAWRRPTGAQAQFANLRLVADLDRHPLHARAWERQMGVAVWNRVGGAALYTANATYSSFAA